ncbi:DUF1883 domain-containing protein [Amycolatopsis lurida]|uniref:DUF1883 domain-containing protein n=1 Tax=Amycolatopsis lurida TaxID=31959 RepID=UPI003658B6F9
MEHLWSEIGSCAGGARFELTLRGTTARVCLMNAENYQAYLDGDEYDLWYSGFWETSPIELVLPHDDFWYLVIDSYPGHVRFWLEGPFD